MKLAIMQPTFNPWIGYFDLISYVDTFVFLDSVQLTKRSWQTRNKLKVNDKEYMFTIPIHKDKSRDSCKINEAKISYQQFDFREKLSSLIIQNYKKAPYYKRDGDEVLNIFQYKTDFLSQYNIHCIAAISKLVGFQTKFILASSMDDLQGSKGDLIFNIVNTLDADIYVSPLGSKEYLEEKRALFKKNNIRISYQYYNHPSYQQIGREFIPFLGIIDLLLNEGIENTKEIILKGRCYEE